MRAIGLIVFIIVVLVYYLVTTYASFFDNIRISNLNPPVSDSVYQIGAQSGDKKVFTFLGDSLTAGVGATVLTSTIPYQISEKLNPDNPVTVRSFGYPGARVNSLVPVSEIQKKQKADLTIIFIGINDVFNRTPVDDFRHDLDTIISNMKQNSAKIVLLTLPYLGTKQSVPFPFESLYNYQLNRYNNEIETVASKNNIQLIDLYVLTKSPLKNSFLFASDAFHPADAGYILIADIIAKEIE